MLQTMFKTVLTEKLQTAIKEGNNYFRQGDYAAMLTHYRAVGIFFEDAEPFYRRQYLINLGIAYRNAGHCDEAINTYIQALDVVGEEDGSDIYALRASLSNVLLDQKRPDEALLFLSPAEKYFKGQFNRERLGEVLETKARALLALGKNLDALAAAHEAVGLLYEFVMDREATNRDVSKSFSRAVNTLSVCTFEVVHDR